MSKPIQAMRRIEAMRRRRRSGLSTGLARLVALALLTIFAAPRDVAATAFGPEIDRHVVRAMEAWRVPGLAMAVIEDGRLVYSRTFGQRDLTTRQPVTARTLFAIGSVTKSFTVAGLALLVRDGKLRWDVPANRYLPVFGVHDDRHTLRMTLRDLVSHRTGVPRHDALWYFDAYSRPELVRRLRHLEPAVPVGARYGYHNLMVVVAGYLAGRVSRTTWEALTRKRLLTPLRMGDTRLSLNGFRAAPDRARPYFPAKGGVVAIRHRSTDVIGPAASVYSNLDDMVKWLAFQLSLGEAPGMRLLSREAMADMRVPRIRVDGKPDDPVLGPEFYAMGFFTRSYRRNMVVRHPGVIDGYTALLSMMPGRKVGLVILSNVSGENGAPTAIERYVYDRVLGLDSLPWIARIKAAQARRQREMAKPASEARPKASKSIVNPAKYIGTYEHPAYGRLRLRIGADGQSLDGLMHGVRFTLRHWRHHEWRVAETAWPLRAGLRFRFAVSSGGRVDRFRTPIADGPTYRLRAGNLLFVREGAKVRRGHEHDRPGTPLMDRLLP